MLHSDVHIDACVYVRLCCKDMFHKHVWKVAIWDMMRCENMAMTMWYQAKLACFGISLKYDMTVQLIGMKNNGQKKERGYECQRDKGWG